MSREREDDPGKSPKGDENLPEGTVVDGASIAKEVDDAFDYVVIGTGAAGAVAAHRLAELGFSVAMIEEGPYIKTREFGPNVLDAFRVMMRDAATQAIEGRSFIPLLQGRCVGGSTVVNSAIAWRLPEDVGDDWSKRFGLAGELDNQALDPHFDALEKELEVTDVKDEALGRNNLEFIDAMNKNGVSYHAMKRYAPDCSGSARCLQGCPTGAKRGMNVSYVPWALRLGARLYCSCRVERVRIEGNRATGVDATAKSGARVLLRAKHGVLVAASTIQTPNVLRRSGLRASAIGKHFQAHPGIGVAGVFDRPIHMDFGTTQGAETSHYRASEGFKVETISMPPELLAARMPGAGTELMKKLGAYPNIGVWGVQIRCEAEGVVKTGFGGRDKVVYSIGERDMMKARKGLAFIAKLMLEQGAKRNLAGRVRASVRDDDRRPSEENRRRIARPARVRLHRDALLRRGAHGPRQKDERRRREFRSARGEGLVRRRLERFPDEPRREPATLDHGGRAARRHAHRAARPKSVRDASGVSRLSPAASECLT